MRSGSGPYQLAAAADGEGLAAEQRRQQQMERWHGPPQPVAPVGNDRADAHRYYQPELAAAPGPRRRARQDWSGL